MVGLQQGRPPVKKNATTISKGCSLVLWLNVEQLTRPVEEKK